MKRKFRFLFILIPITFLALAATATMGLWNWLMPSLFGLTAINFVKALGLFVFIRLLLGGRGWGWRRPHYRFAFSGHPRYMDRAEWQQRMQEKWQNMTPEQRAKFSGKCGWRGSNETTESKQ
jgi:hypothetical protein